MIKDAYGNTRFYGVYRGVVFDAADPLNKGRLRLTVPQVLADFPTEWAWPVMPSGGTFTSPSVGDGVWVQFEGGDPSFPIWTGIFTEVVTSNSSGAPGSFNVLPPITYDSTNNILGINQEGFSRLGSLDYLQMNPTYTDGSREVGQIAWSDHDQTPEVKVGNGEVTLQIGQEFHVRVANGTNAVIPNGRVVYFNGSIGTDGHPTVTQYLADGQVSSFRVAGITTQEIPVGGEGLVTSKGIIRELDTSGFSIGDVLYASPLFLGQITHSIPTPPDEVVVVGVATKIGTTDGEIYSTVVPVINQLTTSITLYQTNVASDISDYYKMVNSQADPSYNTTAVSIPTTIAGAVTVGTSILLSSFAAPANLFVGNPGTAINVTTSGNIEKTSGNTNTRALFYFTVHKRDSSGTEALLGVSSQTGPPGNVTQNQWQEFSADVNVNFGTFTNTDRVVIKFHAYVSEAGAQSYNFQFGGLSPVRTRIPVPVSVVSTSPAYGVSADTTNFNNVLSSADNTVQKALDTLDNSGPPAGTINMWATPSAPAGWLICDGTIKNIADYPKLAAVLGTLYGGNGTTTFGLPNMQGRVPVGQSPSNSQGTVTMSTDDTVTKTNHKLANGQRVYFSTTGALLSGITAGVEYYVVSATANTFKLSTTFGGSAIDLTGTQSGTHTLYLADFNTIGAVGGERAHTLGVDELASHTHTGTTDSGGSHDHGGTTGSDTHNHGGSTSSDTHNHAYEDFGRDLQGGIGGGGTIIAADYRTSGVTDRTGNDTHSHSISNDTHSHTISAHNGHTHTFTSGSTGATLPHLNLQPYIILNYIIKS